MISLFWKRSRTRWKLRSVRFRFIFYALPSRPGFVFLVFMNKRWSSFLTFWGWTPFYVITSHLSFLFAIRYLGSAGRALFLIIKPFWYFTLLLFTLLFWFLQLRGIANLAFTYDYVNMVCWGQDWCVFSSPYTLPCVHLRIYRKLLLCHITPPHTPDDRRMTAAYVDGMSQVWAKVAHANYYPEFLSTYLCGICVDSLFLSTYLCGNFVVFTYQSDFLPLVTSYIITFIITPFGLQYYIFV
jgi:hypothetical protein